MVGRGEAGVDGGPVDFAAVGETVQRADALFELGDAVLCSDSPVTSLVELTLTAEHRRGHGAMYDAVNHGWLEPRRLRRLLASTPLPHAADGRIALAVDVSNWLRPDAPTSQELLFCHVYGRGRSADQFIPGWPYSQFPCSSGLVKLWLFGSVRVSGR